LLAANVLVVGVTVTLLTVGGLRAGQREDAARVMDQRTAVVRTSVLAETGRYLTLLQAVAAGLGANDQFSGTAFDAATEPLDAAGLPGATSVAFVAPSSPGADAATQAYWRARGAGGLVLHPSGDTPEHLYSIFSRSLDGDSPQFTGLDVRGSAEASAALTTARSTGQPAVSDTYVLLRDRLQPDVPRQLSFVFAAPVRTPGGTFRGWIVLGLHSQDFFGGVLSAASQNQLDGQLMAVDGDGHRVVVASVRAPGRPTLHRETTIPVADRIWTLETAADSAYLPGARSSLPLTVLFGGAALTVLLAGLVHVLATGRSRARHKVVLATAELRTAEAESRRQAGLLGAIMTSIGDGVGVVDSSGDFLLHNPAAKALLGVDDEVTGPDDWQGHYGLYRADGHTPFPAAEMPLMRALAGESSNGVEMLVRNAAHPDGLLISVDGRPLDPSGGRHGAVAVFHDITELRRYEQELAVFAGVVAHDLKAPLAIVRGHCETAGDDLDDAPDSPPVAGARASLGRIVHGVDRMAALIDTLLAYTTSRDAPLQIRTVPLGPLVDDVIAGRTGHLRPSDGPAPEIYVGSLPEVDADPAMLRHVLDNLIGNALKYVQPGRVARIDVTSGPAAPGWSRVEIADRGIGIPDEDKPEIFESFHRARTAADYAGTGLGLAICRRVVERHGGVIGVADNPGGGTRFHFTLPLAGTGVAPEPPSVVAVEEPTMPQPYQVPDDLNLPPDADSPPPDNEAEDRVALERALAERDAIIRSALPGALALPAAGPSARRSTAARLQAPVPDHLHHHA
jgi:PAS domain S-box-containing protein